MDFSWTEKQLQSHDRAREFGQSLSGRSIVGFDNEAWKMCADFGLQGLGISPAHGGSGQDLLTHFHTLAGFARGFDNTGLAFALCAQFVGAVSMILQSGNDAQRTRWLPAVANGSCIAAQAVTEAEAGSDVFAMSTRFEETGDGFRLDGHKTYITLAPVANLFLVYATSDPALKHWGLSCFLVERDTVGLEIETLDKMGLNGVPLGALRLEGCEVPASALVGEIGAGAALFSAGQELERAFVLAHLVGVMERGLEQAVEHAKTRIQFGNRIGDFQAVSHRIADMKVRLETATLVAYKAVWQLDNGQGASLSSAIANLALAESSLASSLDLMRVLGAKGYLAGSVGEAGVRDSLGGIIYGGTSEIQKNIIARVLGL